MPAGKRAVVIALALAAGLLSGSQAQAQNWFGRSVGGWRANAMWRAQGGGALLGGEVVGSSSFAAGSTATFTAAQWQEMVTARARQAPTMSAAQWQQLVTAQARQPQLPQPSPAQQLNAARAAAIQQQQIQNALFAEALRQLQQQNAPPLPPHQ
jgi:hypothetical protein